MKDYFGEGMTPSQRRRAGQVIGTIARSLLLTAAVILVVGGFALVGGIAIVIVGLNSWGSNK